ncbi:Arc family DNA-binding protein [Sulfitobacter sp. 1A13679]|uniref:Arc family DNA-binding protein n=1 Tax=Sulfitobacter sp. 1A13679 TaxID=3368597 RepID=UPI00374502AE
MSDAPSRKQEQFIVRFPDGMRDQIKAAAEANNRSMNAEIVHRLELSLTTQSLHGGLENVPTERFIELLGEMQERLRKAYEDEK